MEPTGAMLTAGLTWWKVSSGLFGTISFCFEATFDMKHTNNYSPGPDVQQPFRLILSNEHDIEAIKEAEKNPQLVKVSDCRHLTSEQYQKAMEDSRLGVL
jgi:hypothetical protein